MDGKLCLSANPEKIQADKEVLKSLDKEYNKLVEYRHSCAYKAKRVALAILPVLGLALYVGSIIALCSLPPTASLGLVFACIGGMLAGEFAIVGGIFGSIFVSEDQQLEENTVLERRRSAIACQENDKVRDVAKINEFFQQEQRKNRVDSFKDKIDEIVELATQSVEVDVLEAIKLKHRAQQEQNAAIGELGIPENEEFFEAFTVADIDRWMGEMELFQIEKSA